MLSDILRDECIEILTNATVTGVEGKSGDGVKLHAERNGGKTALEGTHILVATGRTPNTQNIGLELAGAQTTRLRPPKVNESLQKISPGGWAGGECASNPPFSHLPFDYLRGLTPNLPRLRR